MGKERVLPKQVVRWGISTLGIKTGTLVTAEGRRATGRCYTLTWVSVVGHETTVQDIEADLVFQGQEFWR